MAMLLLLRLGRAPQLLRSSLGGLSGPSSALLRPRRHASSTVTVPSRRPVLFSLKLLVYSAALASTLAITYAYATDTRAGAHQWLVPRILRVAFPDAESAHRFGTAALRTLYTVGLHPRERAGSAAALDIPISVFGVTIANPIGISAGLDKHGEILDPLFALGPAVVEVGGCTARPQEGNQRPRVFRIPAVDGLINRYGLNSAGADAVAARLRLRVLRLARDAGLTEQAVLDGDAGVPPGSLLPGRLLLVQIAQNRETTEQEAGADLAYCVRRLGRYADVLVVNVSSPNTPGLRDMQAVAPLTKLLSAVVDEAGRTRRRRPPKVMVKVSPDEDSDAQIGGVVRAVIDSGADGVVVANTTRSRRGIIPDGVPLTVLEKRTVQEEGGFSGPAVFGRTLSLVDRYRKALDGQMMRSGGGAGAEDGKVIFATGGITDGKQALQVLNAGASVAMVYTGLVYGGVGTVTRMKQELADEIRR